MQILSNLQYNSLKMENIPPKFWEGFPFIKGKRVFIKPNLVNPNTLWDQCSTTRVEVVRLVIEKVLQGKPSEIIIGECGFKDQWEATIQSTDYDELVEDYPVKLIPLQDGKNFHKFTLKRIPKGEYLSLFGVKFSDYLLQSEVVINIPKMKVHNMAGITGAIKNMMGTMAQKGSMHPRGSSVILHKRLADLYRLTKTMVNFVVMDGIEGSEYSEQSGVPVYSGVLLSGEDQWEIDVASAKLMGFDPRMIKYLRYINHDFSQIHIPLELIKSYEKPLKYA